MKTVHFDTWQEFREFVDGDHQLGVYWRGQLDPTWPLASRFERVILAYGTSSSEGGSQIYPYDGHFQRDGKPIWGDSKFYHNVRDQYLDNFRRAASGLRGPNPKELTTEEWWALGRHYGLITPLLDWTEKPYIAAFFPLVEFFEQSIGKRGTATEIDEVAIYRLFHDHSLEGDGLRVVKPIVDELGRLQSQRSMFTWLDTEKYFELQGFMDDTGRGNLLTQIILSQEAARFGLIDLDRHGIDYRLLFPDLVGAALAANAQPNI